MDRGGAALIALPLPVPPDRDRPTRVLRLAGLAVIVYVAAELLAPILQITLLIFSGLLLAVALDAAASWSARRLRLPRGLGLALIVTLSVLAVGWFVVALAPALAAELQKLWSVLPGALDRLGEQFGQEGWGQDLVARMPTFEQVAGSGPVLRNAFGALSGAVVLAGAAFLVGFIGLFVAIDPQVYLRGVLHLAGPARRERCEEVLAVVVTALRRWLIARLAGMAIIGVSTWVGLSIIGIPLAFALGVLAAALTFIPNIGPILSVVPAVLIGFLDGPTTALAVTALYAGIQFVETYVISPVLHRRMLSLPPALTLGAQAVLGVFAGSIGLVVATPILAAVVAALMARPAAPDREGPPAGEAEPGEAEPQPA